MELPKNELARLLQAYSQDQLSREEYEVLFRELANPANQVQVQEYLDKRLEAQPAEGSPVGGELDWEGMFNRIAGPEPVVVRPVHRVHFLRRWGWAAAAILLVLGGGVFYLLNRPGQAPAELARKAPGQDIAPGRDGAILTLADGRQVLLNSLGNGVIAREGGARVILEKGQISYLLAGQPGRSVAYNTMSTPKGRQFTVQLPDGSNVWLNAASSIRYPTVFTGKERRVEVTGEAYFEIAPNSSQPFIVSLDKAVAVEVLGTRFNVNAYANEEQLDATLLQGAVRVKQGANTVLLQPGQNARVTNNIQVQPDVDIDKIMAWKNGLFNFEGRKLREVMRQLERWYDIEVAVQPDVPDIEFYGEINRDISLDGVLKALQLSDVRFAVEGRKLIVLR